MHGPSSSTQSAINTHTHTDTLADKIVVQRGTGAYLSARKKEHECECVSSVVCNVMQTWVKSVWRVGKRRLHQQQQSNVLMLLLTGPGRRSRRGPRRRWSWSSRDCWPSTAGSSATTADRPVDRSFAAAVAVQCPCLCLKVYSVVKKINEDKGS